MRVRNGTGVAYPRVLSKTPTRISTAPVGSITYLAHGRRGYKTPLEAEQEASAQVLTQTGGALSLRGLAASPSGSGGTVWATSSVSWSPSGSHGVSSGVSRMDSRSSATMTRCLSTLIKSTFPSVTYD